jgi:hypothetical protein
MRDRDVFAMTRLPTWEMNGIRSRIGQYSQAFQEVPVSGGLAVPGKLSKSGEDRVISTDFYEL